MQTDLIYTYCFFFNQRDGTTDEVGFCAYTCEETENCLLNGA